MCICYTANEIQSVYAVLLKALTFFSRLELGLVLGETKGDHDKLWDKLKTFVYNIFLPSSPSVCLVSAAYVLDFGLF